VESQGEYLPTARELAEYLASKIQFPEGETPDLAKVAQYFGVVGGRLPLLQDLHSIFDHDYPITSLHCNAPQILDTRLSEVMMPKRRVEHGSSSQIYP
jgi:hypothetical protein